MNPTNDNILMNSYFLTRYIDLFYWHDVTFLRREGAELPPSALAGLGLSLDPEARKKAPLAFRRTKKKI